MDTLGLKIVGAVISVKEKKLSEQKLICQYPTLKTALLEMHTLLNVMRLTRKGLL